MHNLNAINKNEHVYQNAECHATSEEEIKIGRLIISVRRYLNSIDGDMCVEAVENFFIDMEAFHLNIFNTIFNHSLDLINVIRAWVQFAVYRYSFRGFDINFRNMKK